MDATYQALVAAGITVFAPNVRGSSGFGKRFINLDNGALKWAPLPPSKHFASFQINVPGF